MAGVDSDGCVNSDTEVSWIHEQRPYWSYCTVDSNAAATLPDDWLHPTDH